MPRMRPPIGHWPSPPNALHRPLPCSEFGTGCDPELRKKFSNQVTVLRTDLQKWASKQSKQVNFACPPQAAAGKQCMQTTKCKPGCGVAGKACHALPSFHSLTLPSHQPVPCCSPCHQIMSAFPAIAALMCCERHEQLVTTIDGFIDVLHKQLRERRIATMAILCLCRVVGCFIRRMSPRSDAGVFTCPPPLFAALRLATAEVLA